MLKKFLEIAHNIIKKHWIIYTIITFIPTIWYSLILTYFGSYVGLLKDESGTKKFTIFGIALTLFVVLVPLIINIIINIYASKSETSELEKLHNEKVFFEQLNKSVDFICAEKYRRLRHVIIEENFPNGIHPSIITSPANQLKQIMAQINECLCVFLSQPGAEYKHKDFFVTIAYRFPQVNETWKWVDDTEQRGLSLEELFQDGVKSTAQYLVKENKPYYFNNKKEDAKLDNKYIYDSIDILNSEKKDDVGSIFCYNFQEKNGRKVYAEAILSVSTYKKRFCPCIGKEENFRNQLKNTEDNMIYIVKDCFGRRIGIELCLLLLEHLHNAETKDKSSETK